MNFAFPIKSSVRSAPRVRDGHLLMAFVTGVAIAICWRISTLISLAEIPGSVLQDRSGIGAAELLVILVLFLHVVRYRNDDLLSPSDVIIIATTSLAFAFPSRLAAFAPITFVGMKLLFRRDPRVYSIGQLLLALAFYEWFGPAIFQVLAPFVIKLEAFAVEALLTPFGGFTRDGLVISGSNGNSIVVEVGCSAFHNLSLATLIWISIIKLQTLTMKPIHWWILAAMAGSTVALNTVRIALMAQSDSMYEYWHNGFGATIVSFALLASVLAISLGGLRPAENH